MAGNLLPPSDSGEGLFKDGTNPPQTDAHAAPKSPAHPRIAVAARGGTAHAHAAVSQDQLARHLAHEHARLAASPGAVAGLPLDETKELVDVGLHSNSCGNAEKQKLVDKENPLAAKARTAGQGTAPFTMPACCDMVCRQRVRVGRPRFHDDAIGMSRGGGATRGFSQCVGAAGPQCGWPPSYFSLRLVRAAKKGERKRRDHHSRKVARLS